MLCLGGNLKKLPKRNKNMKLELKSETSGWFSLGVGSYDVIDPVEEFTYFDVDPGVVGKGTPLTPRHQAVNFSVTHQGAAGVSLSHTEMSVSWCLLMPTYICCGPHVAGVSASIHISGTHHPARDHAGIGSVTVLVTHYGYVQALQTVGHVCYRKKYRLY